MLHQFFVVAKFDVVGVKYAELVTKTRHNADID